MPNNVHNRVFIYGEDEKEITALMKFVNGKSFFDFEKIIPPPNDDHYKNGGWYDWNIEHWGTKWNAYCVFAPNRSDGRIVEYVFSTAWGTPTPVIKALSAKFPKVYISVELSGEIENHDSYQFQNGMEMES